jgi:dUTP pyrophosphatase
MHVRIQKLDLNATIPSYAHPGDAGMDIYSNEDATIAPGERSAVKTGIAMAVPEGYVALVWDKSGRALKEGLTTMAGVVDSGYRGEVMIVMLNTSTSDAEIKKGQKLAQILVQPVASPELVEVESLDESSRGTGGFGSTGL